MKTFTLYLHEEVTLYLHKNVTLYPHEEVTLYLHEGVTLSLCFSTQETSQKVTQLLCKVHNLQTWGIVVPVQQFYLEK